MGFRLLKRLLVLLGAVAVAEADREDRVLEFPRREIPRRPDPRPIAGSKKKCKEKIKGEGKEDTKNGTIWRKDS